MVMTLFYLKFQWLFYFKTLEHRTLFLHVLELLSLFLGDHSLFVKLDDSDKSNQPNNPNDPSDSSRPTCFC